MRARLILLGGLGLLLAGCGQAGGPVLVSGQFPPTTESRNSEPQPLGSLPAGAANWGTAPGALHPNYAGWTFGAR